MYVTDATPEPLRANRIHTPGAEAWFARIHASHSEAEANESASSGRPAAGTARSLRRDVLQGPRTAMRRAHMLPTARRAARMLAGCVRRRRARRSRRLG